MRNFIVFLFIHTFLFLQVYAQTDINDWEAEVYYVKTGNLNVRSKPTSRAKKVGRFRRYQKIVALNTAEDYGKWVKVIYPLRGFVYSKYLIPAEKFKVNPKRIPKSIRRLNNYFVEEIEYPETDFTVDEEGGININLEDVEKFLLLHKTNITKIIYPFSGELKTSPEAFVPSDYVVPEAVDNNWTFEERHVRAYYLNLREKPSERAEVVTTLERNQKIVLVNIFDEKITPGWGHVIYPMEGYVYKRYLYHGTLADSSELENDWHVELEQNGDFPFAVFADSLLTVPSDTIAPNRTYLKLVESKPSKVTRIIYPIKGFAIPEESMIADFEEEKTLGWNLEERYVKASFLNVRTRPSQHAEIKSVVRKNQKVLILNTDEKITRGWKRTLYPIYGYLYAPYLYKKDETLDTSSVVRMPENAWSYEILSCTTDSASIFKTPDAESPTVGVIGKREQAVFVIDSLHGNDWLYEVFPKRGYVIADDFLEYSSKGRYYIGTGILVGPFQLPLEKNLTNYKIPFGAVIDFSNTDWRFSFRLGFFQTQTHNSDYVLKTNQVFLTARYSFLRVMKNSLDFYVGAGLNYWMSKFQLAESPDSVASLNEEEDSDLGYSLSLGAVYSFYDFFIDVQYYFWSSREAVFGEEPQQGEISSQYKLYPGSNQFHIILGYRFKF